VVEPARWIDRRHVSRSGLPPASAMMSGMILAPMPRFCQPGGCNSFCVTQVIGGLLERDAADVRRHRL